MASDVVESSTMEASYPKFSGFASPQVKLVGPWNLGRHYPAAMKRPRPVDSEVGDRVKQLRLALGHAECGDFAREIGVGYNRLNNVENGHPLSKDLAFKLVQSVDGLSTDWLWYGVSDGLSVALERKLREVGTKVG